jgi:hypothetical protein
MNSNTREKAAKNLSHISNTISKLSDSWMKKIAIIQPN